MRIETFGEQEWKVVLRKHWNLNTLSLRESDSRITVMHFGKTKNVSVGYYEKDTKRGVVYDRRHNFREV